MKLKFVLILIFLIGIVSSSQVYGNQVVRIIDTPATTMLDYGAYSLDFRLFSEGGILTRLDFGVFKMVNLGFGWEVRSVIGTEPTIVGPPALYVKFQLYSGGMTLPAFSLGYDGQGYFYDRDVNEFVYKEKGIFLVFGREVFTPGLELNFGANMNDFQENLVYGFISTTYNAEDKVMFMVEYDNINYFPEARLNVGLRMFITPDINIDLAGRDLGAGGRDPERIVRIMYLGRF